MKTAIILTGGAGTRMAPVTRTLNKSLIPIDGTPILVKILSQLNSLELEKLVIMSGHLSWQVEDVLSELPADFRAKIKIYSTPPHFSPAERLLTGYESWVDSSEIILIYCDNFIDSEDLRLHLTISREDRVIIQRRTPGNIDIDDTGRAIYFRSRSERHKFVELGYWRLSPNLFSKILREYKDLQEALEVYSRHNSIQVTEVGEYVSVSNLDRYSLHRRQKRNTVFLDRDGVLVASVDKGKYLKSSNEVTFLEANAKLFRDLSEKYQIDYIVVTNQAGVQRKIITSDEVELINQYIAIHMLKNNVPILAFYVCPHHWDTGCDCRKPKAGLINLAISQFSLDPSKCILFGDRQSDIEAGRSSGIQSFLLAEGMDNFERERTVYEAISFLENIK